MRFITALTFSLLSLAVHAEQISAWVADAPAVVPVRAAYLSLENKSEKPVTLVSVTSDRFEKIEIHESIESDGVVSMRQLDGWVVAPNSKAEMSPGGVHLMLFKPKTKVENGENIALELRFSDNSEQVVSAVVKKADDTDNHHHHH